MNTTDLEAVRNAITALRNVEHRLMGSTAHAKIPSNEVIANNRPDNKQWVVTSAQPHLQAELVYCKAGDEHHTSLYQPRQTLVQEPNESNSDFMVRCATAIEELQGNDNLLLSIDVRMQRGSPTLGVEDKPQANMTSVVTESSNATPVDRAEVKTGVDLSPHDPVPNVDSNTLGDAAASSDHLDRERMPAGFTDGRIHPERVDTLYDTPNTTKANSTTPPESRL